MSIVRPADPGWKPAAEAELAHLRLTWGRWYQVSHHAESASGLPVTGRRASR